MNQKRAWFYFFILAITFVGLVSLLLLQLKSATTQIKNKPRIAQEGKQGRVLSGGTGYVLTLKDSSNNQMILQNATITLTNPREVMTCYGVSDPWVFTPPYQTDPVGLLDVWSLGCTPAPGHPDLPSATVTITKSGYKTKTATLTPGLWEDNVVSITPLDTQPPSAPGNLRATSITSTSATLAWNASTDNVGVAGYKVFKNNVQTATTSKTSYTDSSLSPATSYSYFVKAYDAEGNLSAASNTITVSTTLTIKDVVLPSAFTQTGSSSTNLATIADPKNVTNLTIEVVGKNKIVWNEAVDLSSMETANKFKSLDQYIKATKVGVVEVDSKNLAELNKKATITMFNLPFLTMPKILVDGKENPKIVSNMTYKNGNLTFTAAHFTKFEAVPTLVILEPQNGFVTRKAQISLKGKSLTRLQPLVRL